MTADKIMEIYIACEKLCPHNQMCKILFLIKQNKMVSPAFLMDKLCIVKTNLANLTKQMESRKLIEKNKTSCDKRNVFYSITPRGEDYLQKEMKVLFEKTNDLVFKNEQLDQTISYLNNINRSKND